MEDMKEFEKELMIEDSENILNTYKRFPVVLKEGKGATLKDYTGKEYIDFSSGIGTNSFGACDKEWVDAVVHQANTLQPAQIFQLLNGVSAHVLKLKFDLPYPIYHRY